MVSQVLSHSLSEPHETHYCQRASVGSVIRYISPHPPYEKSLSSLNYGFVSEAAEIFLPRGYSKGVTDFISVFALATESFRAKLTTPCSTCVRL